MLTILSVGYPMAPVSTDAVGGAEQVLAQLDRAIVRAGHRSLVVAPRGSTCSGHLVAIEPAAEPFDDAALAAARARCRSAIETVLSTEDVDIVHFHGVDCAEYLPSSAGVPIVVTLHLWPDRYPNARPRFERAQAHLVSVSRAQASACAAAGMRVCRTIPNGVEVQTFRGQPVRESSVLLLGRISPEKGFHLAIDAARRASLSVLLAGAVFPYASHREYFEYVIVPRLAGDVRFIGPVDAHAKRTLLGTVSCVGLPSIVPETSSLTAMEALASGTPVVALRSPALEELIDHGRTGFLVDDVDGMAQAFASIHAIGPDACRQAAEQRCQLTHMTAAYLQLYEELAYEHGSDGLGAGASGTQVAPFARHE